MLIRFIIFIFITFGFSIPAKAQEIYGFSASYDIYAGGTKGVSAKVEIKQNLEEYEVKTTAVTEGFIAVLYPLTTIYLSKGQIDNKIAYSSSYLHSSFSRGKETRKELFYDKLGRVTLKKNLKKGIETITEVRDESNLGESIDFQTVTMLMLKKAAKQLDCSGSYKSFDGKKRHILSFFKAESDYIAKNQYSIFEGEAVVCNAKVAVADEGFSDSWFWFKKGKGGRSVDMKIWLAAFGEQKIAVPVRVEVETMGFGTVVAHLSAMPATF